MRKQWLLCRYTEKQQKINKKKIRPTIIKETKKTNEHWEKF